jgi:N-methylhydantoinase A/oxoprolinase/acetone carboxylase beta subunit
LKLTAWHCRTNPIWSSSFAGCCLRGSLTAPAAGAAARREVYFAGVGGFVPTPIDQRTKLPAGMRLDGTAMIQEYGSTTVRPPGDRRSGAAKGVLMIEVGEG